MISKRGQVSLTAVLVAAAAFGISLTSNYYAAASPDLAKVIQDRRQFMKGNGQQMVTINNFLEKGQGTSGDVVNAADLAANSKKIVDMFPKGTPNRHLRMGLGNPSSMPIHMTVSSRVNLTSIIACFLTTPAASLVTTVSR